MSEVTKDQMLMRADDIEDVLNDVFARNMPELQEDYFWDTEELGMGFEKFDEVIREHKEIFETETIKPKGEKS